MSYVSTKIMEALLKNEPIEEVFRQELESAINRLLVIELDSFLNYDRYDPAGYNSGDSRNGYYSRILHTEHGDLDIRVPRDREGLFHQKTLAPYQRNSDSLETTIVEFYKHGITIREIADLIEKMYGQYYSPQTISNISRAVEVQVQEFHRRPMSSRYVVVFCDATYLRFCFPTRHICKNAPAACIYLPLGWNAFNFVYIHHGRHHRGKQTVPVIIHLAYNDHGAPAVVFDVADHTHRAVHAYIADEIHGKACRHDCLPDRSAGHPKHGVGQRSQHAPVGHISVVGVLVMFNMQADLCAPAINLIDMNVEEIRHKAVMLINLPDTCGNVQKISCLRVPR